MDVSKRILFRPGVGREVNWLTAAMYAIRADKNISSGRSAVLEKDCHFLVVLFNPICLLAPLDVDTGGERLSEAKAAHSEAWCFGRVLEHKLLWSHVENSLGGQGQRREMGCCVPETRDVVWEGISKEGIGAREMC